MKRVRRSPSPVQSHSMELRHSSELEIQQEQDEAFRKLVGLDVAPPQTDDSKEHDHRPADAPRGRPKISIESIIAQRVLLRILLRVCLVTCLILIVRTTSSTLRFHQEVSLSDHDTSSEVPSTVVPGSPNPHTVVTNTTLRALTSSSKAEPNRQSLRLGSRVPKALNGLADLSTPFNSRTETPYFWDIHFAGETIAESVFRKCHFLIQACEHGLKQPRFNQDKLEVFESPNGALYVNVDTTSVSGIHRAKQLQLAQKHMADVMISPRLHDFVGDIFMDAAHRGRLFALFRHPVDRAITMYYYLATASWDPQYNPALKEMTLEEYSRSASMENNWMTRFLVNKPGGQLSKEDMLEAKEILRTKCLVGLYEDLEASLWRFSMYFGWSKEDTNADNCRTAVVQAGDPRHEHPPIESFGSEWNAIAAVNQYDLELYEYARVLYRYQGEQIFGLNTPVEREIHIF